MRGETNHNFFLSMFHVFQSTPLMRGETHIPFHKHHNSLISIHSPHARGDDCSLIIALYWFNFNPLPSCEGRRRSSRQQQTRQLISIHSPHARGDRAYSLTPFIHAISIHSPHARGDILFRHCLRDSGFQSTPLMRGETIVQEYADRAASDFNPLPSCEGRHELDAADMRANVNFNPLPSCEGRRGTSDD